MSDRRTITERLEDIAGEICDNICKYTERAENGELDKEELYRTCETCPLTKL